MITLDTATQLEALALSIFNPANPSAGLQGPDPAIDAQYYALIAPVMLAVDGRVMAPGFRYTLNVTNSLQGRPKHWYIVSLCEFEPGSPAFASMSLELTIPATNIWAYQNSSGFSLALATCAAVCLAWAAIIRSWLAGGYSSAVAQPVP